jgi:hypothetical protein
MVGATLPGVATSTSQPARTNLSCMTMNSSAQTPLSYVLPSARVHVDAADSTIRILLIVVHSSGECRWLNRSPPP